MPRCEAAGASLTRTHEFTRRLYMRMVGGELIKGAAGCVINSPGFGYKNDPSTILYIAAAKKSLPE